MLLIQQAMLYIFDDSPLAPICPNALLPLGDASIEYMNALWRRVQTSEDKRSTRFSPESAAREALEKGETHFHRSNALLQVIYAAMQAAEIPTQGFDILTFCFETENVSYFALFYLPYRAAGVHAVTGTGEDIETAIYKNKYILPGAANKSVAGAVVNLETMEVCVKDVQAVTVTGERPLFSGVLLGLEAVRSTAEAVSAVEEIVTRVAEQSPVADERPVQETVRRAMAASLQETGALDVGFIATELFASDGECAQRVSEAMEEAGIEPVISVESTRIKNAFEKIRLSTDNGVSITLPRAVADDAESFRILNNPDGSISIEIRNIQSVETKN